MIRVLLNVLLLLFLSQQTLCCVSTSEQALLKSPENAKVAKYWKSLTKEASFKNFVNMTKYKNEYYNTHKKPLLNGEELFSDFDSDHCCCWGSQSSGAATGPQSVDWRIAKITSAELLQSTFLNGSLPKGNFLFATPPNKVSQSATANFISCEIKCTNDPVLVTLKHWVSPGVVVKVCKSADGSVENVDNCEIVSSIKTPGPSTFEIPPGRRFQLVIQASNFTEGSFAAVDDISASAKPCSKQDSRGLIKSSNSDACKKVTCDFEEGLCDYQSLPVDQKLSNLILTAGRIGNKVNGVFGPANGKTYVGSLLKPNQRFFMSVTNLELDEDAVLRFDVLEKTDGLQLLVCFDGQDCPYATTLGLKASDNSWNEISVPLPAKTKTISFLATNDGTTTGAVGLDNVQLLIPKGKFPEDATESYC